ncbi:MAG: CHAT domain-containing protein [Chloroflexi bacterium]|nr:CHAT domain-containing protein [Chloroflexota bacterium]
MTQTDQFLDLEIHILPCQDAVYPIQITLGSGQDFQGHLPASILPWTSSGDSLHDGQSLFHTLFADPALRTAWDQALGQSIQRRVRLRIAADAPELHTIPWELLRPDDAPTQPPLSVNADTPFSRYLAVPQPWGSAAKERPIRVLAAISNPNDLEEMHDLPALDTDAERNSLEQAFLALDENEVELNFLDPPITLERIEDALQQGTPGCHILHYLGHGKFSDRRQQAYLYLQDDDGDAKLVRDTDLVQMLARQPAQARPRLIFLASCHTAQAPPVGAHSTADAFRGLAPKLVTAGVPAVIAMQGTVAIKTARKLSLTFYKRLIQHGLVDRALNQARSILLAAGLPDAAVPVLFMRLKSGQLWDTSVEPPAEPPPPPAAKHIHIQDSQVGVIGDGAKIEGGINFGPTTHIQQTAKDNATQIGTVQGDITIKK